MNKNKQVAIEAARHNFPVLALDEQYTKQKVYHMTKHIEEEIPDTERSQPKVLFLLNSGLDSSWLPTAGTFGAVGYDCKSADKDMTLTKADNGKTIMIDLGIRAIIPQGYWLEIRPRSSTFAKLNLVCLDGILDNDYTGAIKLAFKPFIVENEEVTITHGQKVAQLILHKKETFEAQEASEEEFSKLAEEKIKHRNPAGFGTTGK